MKALITIIVLANLMFFVMGTALFELNGEKVDLEKENTLLKVIIKTDLDTLEASSISQKANDYYLEAGYAYENEDYNGVETNCRIARSYYHEASQEYLRILAELKGYEVNDTLIDKYSDCLELASEINLNMYEACEHFESASRYYDIYFNTDVPVSDVSFKMAGNEIDAMNEKIRLHDDNVRKYNQLINEFQVELEKRIS